ncbi:SpoIIE family protein phosphatase [Sulfurimonas sp.]
MNEGSKEKYSTYQEELAFAKELNILRNDFYYQLIDAKNPSLVDFMYNPLDILSGDAYTARRIDNHQTFYLIVDGMGKGLSASLSAMMMTSFINYRIDKMIEFDNFSLEMLIKESMEFIQPILLDEEALSIDYIIFDAHYKELHFAKFAMPPFLIEAANGDIIKIKSNNMPMSKWQNEFNVEKYNVEGIEKFLFYSDGIVENSTKEKDKIYAEFVEEDFKASFTREEFKTKLLSRIDTQEDDLTLIFINTLQLNENAFVASKKFETSLLLIDKANEWYSELFHTLSNNEKAAYSANVVFTELFMNAYEHGNLGIDSSLKHKLLEEDIYFDKLLELEKDVKKKIEVKIYKFVNLTSTYVVTQIIDEGEGFDTQILSQIFRNSQQFNGRGVFVSRKNSMGIYYNCQGNKVLFLNKI